MELIKVVNVKSLIKLMVSIRNEQGEKEGRWWWWRRRRRRRIEEAVEEKEEE